MSNQAYITGDLQIRSLTGALTATSGVVSSLPLGTANGIATLGTDGKVPSSQLPTMGSSYKGTWDASTNTPYIQDGTGTAGDYYLVSVGGTQNLGSGSQTFVAGNSVIYSGTIWQKAGGGSGTVTSVGFTAPAAFTVTGSPVTSAGTIALTGAGTGSQYIKGDGTLATFPTIPTISGTANYVTKFTGSSTIGNSVIYDNGTNVGIGNTSPGDLLQVGSSTTRGTMSIFGTSSGRPVLQFNNTAASGGNAWNLYAGLTAAGSFDIYDGGTATTRFSIVNNGNVLIGTTTDAGYKLAINGTVVASSFYQSSDARLKNIETSIPSKNINTITYRWKDNRDVNLHWGYTAQDVETYIPDATFVDNEGMMSVDYTQVHTYKIAKLEQEIEKLKDFIYGNR